MTKSAETLRHPIMYAIETAELMHDDNSAPDGADKPRLLVNQTSPDVTVEQLREILADAGGLYDRGTPVRPFRDSSEATMKAQHLGAQDLVLHTHRVCRPYAIKCDGKGETREEDVRLPLYLAEMYLGLQGEWRLPVLNGIAHSPLLHEDGSLHASTGYNAATGMWCETVPDLSRLLPSRPTRADAEEALRTLRHTFRTFCFADAKMNFDPSLGVDVVDPELSPGLDESTFHTALLTAICRASLPHAPGILIRAAAMSGAGAGKGLLARCIALIAFGREPHAVSCGTAREELEKRIGAELMEAGPMLFLDNLNNRTFKSDLLASVITERPTRVRLLGRSQMVSLNASALVVLTGNGLLLSEDLARRFVAIELDPRTEDPEARSFKTDILATCRDKRAALLAAALTIWRWGRHGADLAQGRPLGGFTQWCRWVRDPLLALGCQDPVIRVGETKSRDSERETIREIFETWWRCHGDCAVALRELHHEVRQVIDPAGRGRQWTASRLEKLSGTRTAGWMLMRQPAASNWGVALYALSLTKEAETHRDDRDPVQCQDPHQPPYGPYGPYGPVGASKLGVDGEDRAAIPPSRSQTPHDLGEAETHRDHRDHRDHQCSATRNDTGDAEHLMAPQRAEVIDDDGVKPDNKWRRRM